jgi:hypothetical protein
VHRIGVAAGPLGHLRGREFLVTENVGHTELGHRGEDVRLRELVTGFGDRQVGGQHPIRHVQQAPPKPDCHSHRHCRRRTARTSSRWMSAVSPHMTASAAVARAPARVR